ncbi:MAG: hypothetical protein IJW99_05885 [Clostridia bacterium]|nr:hypothetical protein [Clostridia bacterium]
MTYLVFSFDVEDYINPNAADGILWSAELLRREGIRGCFNIVGRLAEALVAWGREDVIEALKHHEIDLHSLAHSHHPTINEYTDLADYGAARAEFDRREHEAREIIGRIFGVDAFPAACPPGSSVSYVAHYGYAEMGVPIYTGDLLVDPVHGRPIHNCNVTSLDYHIYLEKFLLQNDRAGIDAHLDKVAGSMETYVMAHHPQMAIINKFCDLINFNGENVPPERWVLSPVRTAEETARFYENFAYLVKKVKNDPRFRIVTYEELAQIYCAEERRIDAALIPVLRDRLREDFFPLTEPGSYCLSDIFLACRDLLAGKDTHVCGKVYGFLEEPYAIEAPLTVTAEEIRAAAPTVGDGFLPTALRVGEHTVGPADWLRGALEVLCGAERVELTPGPWQIDLNEFPAVRDMKLSDGWIHCASFRDRYLSHRFRLQSWTYRLPANSARRIFA